MRYSKVKPENHGIHRKDIADHAPRTADTVAVS